VQTVIARGPNTRSAVHYDVAAGPSQIHRTFAVVHPSLVSCLQKASFQAAPPSQPPMSRFPFHLSYVRDSVAVLARSRPNHDRLHVVALFTTLFIIQTCRAGEMQATLLFAERSPLSWKKSMYGYLLATDYAGLGLSTLVILPFLIRMFHMADMSMVLIGVGFRIVRLIIMAASTTTLGIYVSVIIGAPSSLIVSCGKALISKTIHVRIHINIYIICIYDEDKNI
jgi:hypothetical protein